MLHIGCTKSRRSSARDRPGPRPGIPLFASVRHRLGGHKSWPGPGLNFRFIYRIFRRIRRLLKCRNAPLKIGVVSYNEYKSYILIFTLEFFLFYIKNALVRKNKERACQKRFEVRHALMKSLCNYDSIT